MLLVGSERPVEQIACFWLSPVVYRVLVSKVRKESAVRAAGGEINAEGGEESDRESARSAESPRRQRSLDGTDARMRRRSGSVGNDDGDVSGDESASGDVDDGRERRSPRLGTVAVADPKGGDETENGEEDGDDDDNDNDDDDDDDDDDDQSDVSN